MQAIMVEFPRIFALDILLIDVNNNAANFLPCLLYKAFDAPHKLMINERNKKKMKYPGSD